MGSCSTISVYTRLDVEKTTAVVATMDVVITSTLVTGDLGIFKKSQYVPCAGKFERLELSVIEPSTQKVPDVVYPSVKILKTVPLYIGKGNIIYKIYTNACNDVILCSKETLDKIVAIITSDYILRKDYDEKLIATLYSIGMLSEHPVLDHPPRIIHQEDIHSEIISNIENNILDKIGWFTLIPETVEIEITRRCNLKCVHCCRDCPTVSEDFDSTKLIKIINNLGKIGTVGITFTGGEPLLYNKIEKILKVAKSNYLSIAILTNGSMLADEEFFRSLAKYAGSIQFSLYGPTAEIHEKITQVRGSFNLLMTAVKNILKYNASYQKGVSFHFNYVIVKGLNDDPKILEDVIKVFRTLPAKIRFTSVVPEGRGKSLDNYTSSELSTLGIYIQSLAKRYGVSEKIITGGLPSMDSPKKDAIVFGCPAARDFMFIGLEEYASPCDTVYNYHRIPLQDDILKVWLSDLFMEYRKVPDESCPFKYICGGPCKYDFNRSAHQN